MFSHLKNIQSVSNRKFWNFQVNKHPARSIHSSGCVLDSQLKYYEMITVDSYKNQSNCIYCSPISCTTNLIILWRNLSILVNERTFRIYWQKCLIVAFANKTFPWKRLRNVFDNKQEICFWLMKVGIYVLIKKISLYFSIFVIFAKKLIKMWNFLY